MDLDFEALLDAPLQAPGDQPKPATVPAPPPPSTNGVKETSKEIEKPKEKDKEKEKKERDRKRRKRKRSSSRDRDRDRKHRSRSRSKRSRRTRSRSRGRSRDYERRRRSLTPPRPRTPPMSLEERERLRMEEEAERDSRTVFAYNLPIRATKGELYEFFETVGKVRDVRLISDRNSRKSKGFGYIEYYSADSVIPALHLSGTQFMGQTVMVQATQAEKNKTALPTPNTPSSAGPSRLYVGALHVDVTEDHLHSIFRPFGPIKFVTIHTDDKTKRSKGFGFVQFDDSEDAKKALQYANALEVAGKTIKVGLVNENTPSSGAMAGELDDDAGGGLSLNAQSRVMLMAKLQRGTMGIPGLPGGTAIPGVAASGVLGGLAPNVGSAVPVPSLVPLNPMLSGMPQVKLPDPPSCCFQLKNMFDPSRYFFINFCFFFSSELLLFVITLSVHQTIVLVVIIHNWL